MFSPDKDFMKIILLQDVPALGKRNEVKEVSGGYARNFLLPRRLAEVATDTAIASLTAKKARDEKAKSDEEKKYTATADKLKTVALSFKVKIGGKGKAFGSVSAVKIQEALQKQGIHVEKDWIMLDTPIKTTGEKVVGIKFPHDTKGEVKIIVEAE